MDLNALGFSSVALALLAAASVLIFALSMVLLFGQRQEEQARAARMDLVRRFSGSISARIEEITGELSLTDFLLRLSTTKRAAVRLELSLSMAGFTGSKPLRLIRLAKFAGFAIGGLTMQFGVTAGLMPLPAGIVVWVLMYFAPDLWLRSQISQRAKKIGWQLPEALELLQLCVRAGLGFTSGLQEVAKTQKGAVSAEFSRVLQEMQFGTSRIDAFTNLGERTKQPDLIRFANAMVRADQAGITVADMLAEQARSMRERRTTMAREQAQQVSVKILAPLMVCFMPGVFIVALGPAVITAISTLSG